MVALGVMCGYGEISCKLNEVNYSTHFESPKIAYFKNLFHF